MYTQEQEKASAIRRLYVFLAGIYFIQGISQGGPTGLFYLPVRFMLINQLGFQQQQLSYFAGLVLIPWTIKPIYGLLSDFIPMFGYRRRSWYAFAALVGISCSLYLALFCDYTRSQLLTFMIGQALSFAFCDVLCDAVMVEQGKPLGLLDKAQGVQWASICFAAVLAGLGGGLVATYLSYQYTFFLMAAPSIAVLVLGVFFVPEKRYQYKESGKSQLAGAIAGGKPEEIAYTVIVAGIVLASLLYLNKVYRYMEILDFLLLISPFLILGSLLFLFHRILNKMTYFCILFLFWVDFSLWLNSSPFFLYQKFTLGFDQMFMGKLQTIGSLGGLVGALLFLAVSRRKIFWKEKFLAETNLANLLKWAGFIGIVVILTSFFLMGKKSAIVLGIGTAFIYQFSRLTTLVLAGEFCPTQISGTFFALLMSVSNLGSAMSERASGKMFEIFSKLAPNNFADNFWAKFLTWLGWPTQHADPKAPYDIFVQYYTIGWLTIVSLVAFSLYFLAIRRFGNSIKEKKKLPNLEISPKTLILRFQIKKSAKKLPEKDRKAILKFLYFMQEKNIAIFQIILSSIKLYLGQPEIDIKALRNSCANALKKSRIRISKVN